MSVVLVVLFAAVVAIGPAFHNHPLSASDAPRSLSAVDLCGLCVTGGTNAIFAVLSSAVTLAFLFSITLELPLAPATMALRIRASRAPPRR
jgi:hypothetical protein